MKFSILILPIVIVHVSSSVIPLGVTVGIHPQSHSIQSLYHAQDVLGQYSYGYATPTSTKAETKTVDGITRGGYSYIDSNGILQTVEYVADPVHGFRVAASNLPQDLPDVAYAKAQHLAEFQAVKNERELVAQRVVQYTNPIAVPISAVPHVPLVSLPQPVQDLPEVVKARNEHLAALHLATISAGILPHQVQDLPEVVRARAEHLAAVEATKLRDATWNSGVALSPIPNDLSGVVVPVHTGSISAGHIVSVAPSPVVAYAPAIPAAPSAQYQAQDGLGQYSYGYIGPLSAKTETKTADGVTRGGYSYIDANGILQTVNYIADAVHGFRVAATNLPRAPHPQPAPIVTVSAATANAAVQGAHIEKIVAPALYKTQIVY